MDPQKSAMVVPIAAAIQHGGSTTSAMPQNVRPFSVGMCGCMEDCGQCLYAYFCLACFMCGLASRLKESCCVALAYPAGCMAMRTKVRVMHGIKGSICDDCIMSCVCPGLTACQLDREMTNCGL